jgi:nitroreductase
MELFEALNGRRSVRKFTGEKVDEADLEKILESAILAPSAGNCQSWEFVVVKDKKTRQKLAEAAFGQSFVAEAPMVIVVCADISRSSSSYGSRGEKLYSIQDTAAATYGILLAAHALGYGGCWVGAFDEAQVTKVIHAPAGVRPLAMVPIGRPAERPGQRSRIPLGQVVHSNSF